MNPTEIISLFDKFLVERNLGLEAVLIGGAALALHGVITRDTRDCDIIEPELEDWRTRLQAAYRGKAITLWSPGREDFLLTKLFALCDRGLDLGDCVALGPTQEELAAAAAWGVLQDANPDWPAHVRATFLDLGRRCGHGV